MFEKVDLKKRKIDFQADKDQKHKFQPTIYIKISGSLSLVAYILTRPYFLVKLMTTPSLLYQENLYVLPSSRKHVQQNTVGEVFSFIQMYITDVLMTGISSSLTSKLGSKNAEDMPHFPLDYAYDT